MAYAFPYNYNIFFLFVNQSILLLKAISVFLAIHAYSCLTHQTLLLWFSSAKSSWHYLNEIRLRSNDQSLRLLI